MIKIEISMEDLRDLIKERDDLIAENTELRSTPIAFSLQKLANDIANHKAAHSLTPDQTRAIFEAISNYNSRDARV